MGGLLDKPKAVKAPPVPPPPPIPTVGQEAGEQAQKKRPRGRRDTFLTGALVPEQDTGRAFLR